MRTLATTLAILAVLTGSSVWTFAAEGSTPSGTTPSAKGITNTTSGAGEWPTIQLRALPALEPIRRQVPDAGHRLAR